MSLVLKVLVTALLVTLATTISKRSTLWGGIITSLPINSILILSWVYWDTRDPIKVAALCHSILLMIFPTLIFFIILPFLLKRQVAFPLSLLSSCIITAGCYWLATCLYSKLGWKI